MGDLSEALIKAKSGLRNSVHSVTMMSASAFLSASSCVSAKVIFFSSLKIRFPSSIATGS